MIRLNKYLADVGLASRRQADEIIASGKIKVNGKIVRELGVMVDAEKDIVEFRGKRLQAESGHVYIMLHKPKGVVSTVKDELKRKTVVGMVGSKVRVFPVGRLDQDTTGLILLTNDGDLANKVTHPKFHLAKKYEVVIAGKEVETRAINILRKGVVFERRKSLPAKVEIIKETGAYVVMEMTIREGRNRQIRKMCEAVGLTLLGLKRVSIGELELGTLPVGKWRYMEEGEIKNKLGVEVVK